MHVCARVDHILTLKQVREALGKGAPLFPSLRATFLRAPQHRNNTQNEMIHSVGGTRKLSVKGLLLSYNVIPFTSVSYQAIRK